MVLALYELGGHEPKCAAAWLWRRLGYARGWPDAGKMASLERVVENEFLQSDITLGGAVAALGPEGSRARSLANSFHHDWQLALWVAEANTVSGAAPSSAALSARAQQLQLGACGEPVAPQSARLSDCARSWAMRWRRRNGARMSKLATRGPVQLEEMRAKAVASVVQGAFRYASPVCRFRFSGRSGATFFQPVDAFRGPNFAPAWRSQNWDHPTFR